MVLGYEVQDDGRIGSIPFSLIEEPLTLLIHRAALAITTWAVSKRSFSAPASQKQGMGEVRSFIFLRPQSTSLSFQEYTHYVAASRPRAPFDFLM